MSHVIGGSDVRNARFERGIDSIPDTILRSRRSGVNPRQVAVRSSPDSNTAAADWKLPMAAAPG